MLYFTRSAGFEHPPVTRTDDQLSESEKLLTKWGKKAGIDVVCSKDGAVFDGDLDQFDGFVFYTSGNLCGKCDHPQPGEPISPEGKKKFLTAIGAGKGFVGIHSSTDSFHSPGVDPYIAMIGAEFVIHGAQQKAMMKVTSPKFPGMEGLGDSFTLFEEWYSLYKFAKDLHVLLVQETKGMTGEPYQRPPYPATWARMQGKGRVFYTSMGHNEIWHQKSLPPGAHGRPRLGRPRRRRRRHPEHRRSDPRRQQDEILNRWRFRRRRAIRWSGSRPLSRQVNHGDTEGTEMRVR